MTKLAVISDSHWSKLWVERFAQLAKQSDFDAVVHLGDGVSDAKWLARELEVPVRFIGGNCDPRRSCDRELRLSYERARLLAVHGDQYGVKYDLSRLSYYAEEIGAQAALFGHTHRPTVCYMGKVLMVNPGALRDGRYAELEIDGERIVPRLKEMPDARAF